MMINAAATSSLITMTPFRAPVYPWRRLKDQACVLHRACGHLVSRNAVRMIPPFDDFGVLPPGVHPATLDEIQDRFGRESEVRRAQMESVRWLVDLAVRAGAARIV